MNPFLRVRLLPLILGFGAQLLSLSAQAAPTNLTQLAFVKASNTGANDQFGYSVAISGNTMVVGAPQEDFSQPPAI